MISLSRFRFDQNNPEKSGTPLSTTVMGPSAIDDTGRVLLGEEFEKHTRAMGLCPRCGETRTHLRVKMGLCLTPRLKPITSENGKGTYDVYKGYCLGPRCFSLNEVKRMLGEPIVKVNKPSPRKKMQKKTGTPLVVSSETDEKGHFKKSKDLSLLVKTKTGRPVLTGRAKESPKGRKDLSLVVTDSGRPIFAETSKESNGLTDGSNGPTNVRPRKKDRKGKRKQPQEASPPYDLEVFSSPQSQDVPVDVDFVTEILKDPGLRGKHVTIHMESHGDLAVEKQEVTEQTGGNRDGNPMESRQEVDQSKADGFKASSEASNKELDDHRASPMISPPVSEDMIEAFEEQMTSRSRSNISRKEFKPKKKYLAALLPTRSTTCKDRGKVTGKHIEASLPSPDSPVVDHTVVLDRSGGIASPPTSTLSNPMPPSHVEKSLSSDNSGSKDDSASIHAPPSTVAIVVTPCTEVSCLSAVDTGELIIGFEVELTRDILPAMSESCASGSTDFDQVDSESDEEDIPSTSPSSASEEVKATPSFMDDNEAFKELVEPNITRTDILDTSKSAISSSESRGYDGSTVSTLSQECTPVESITRAPERYLESMASVTTVAAGNTTGSMFKDTKATNTDRGLFSEARKSCNGINIPPKHPLRSGNMAISSGASQSSGRSWRSTTSGNAHNTRSLGLEECESVVSEVSTKSDTLRIASGPKRRSLRSFISKSTQKSHQQERGGDKSVRSSFTTTIRKRCDVSVAPSLARSHYPMNDASLRHAINAGVLWQTLVGQHVRFPDKWFGGARAPQMGVNNVLNKKGEKVPEHRWVYIARDIFHSEPVLSKFVPDEFSPGRLLLHIVIRDEDWKPVLDVAIGCYHPKKGMDSRTVWMALRKRSGHRTKHTTLIEPILTSECRIEDIKMASPLGKGHRLHNKSLESLFGDEPPVQTVFILETELVKQVRDFRARGYILDFKPITLVLVKIFVSSGIEG